MRKARKFMSLALSAAMVVGMAATTPVMDGCRHGCYHTSDG